MSSEAMSSEVMTGDALFESVADLGAAIHARHVSCTDAAQQAFDRIHRLDPALNSFITLVSDSALAQAKVLDDEIAHGKYRGPLHGIPISVKDHIDTAGIRTTAGAKSRVANIPATDAGVVKRLKAAGAVIVGKANMNKFADGESGDNPDFGKIRNPWNTAYSPGGSSSGSGAHVAAGMVPLSVGTDNGGSVRIPAALCGIVGLKPTHGRASLEGIFPRLYSLDHPGPLTRSVEDCAIALQVLAGHDAGDRTTARHAVPDYRSALRSGIKGMLIGVDHAYVSVGQPDVLSAFDAALATLRSLGARIMDVTIPTAEQLGAVGNTIASCEYSVAAAQLFHDHPTDFECGRPASIEHRGHQGGLTHPGSRLHPRDAAAPRSAGSLRQGDTRRGRHRDTHVPAGWAPIRSLPARPGQGVHRERRHTLHVRVRRARRPRDLRPLRLLTRRLPDRPAIRRPPVRRSDGAPRRIRLRTGDRLAHPPPKRDSDPVPVPA